MLRVSKPSSSFFTSLPIELLCNIFLLASSRTDDDDDDDSNSSPQGATNLAISQVCTHWRRVALSVGSLWSRIIVPKYPGANFEYTKSLLERSQGCLLDVTIDASFYSFETSFGGAIACLGSSSIKRLGSFGLKTNLDREMDDGLSWLLAGPTPLPLHTLELSRSPQDSAPILGAKLAKLAERSPNLKHITISRIHYPWESPPTGLLSLKLTELLVDIRATPEQLENFLRSCPLLETLELTNSGARIADPGRPYSNTSMSPPVALNYLQTLSLDNMHPHQVTHILSCTSAPTLRVVTISIRRRPWEANFGGQHPLSSFFIRQAKERPDRRSAVVELSLGNVELPRKDMAAFFDALTELETLTVNGCDVVDILTPPMSKLKVKLATRTPRCPKLRNLGFMATNDVNMRSLKDLVHARLTLSAVGTTKAIVLLNVDDIVNEDWRSDEETWLKANVPDFYW